MKTNNMRTFFIVWAGQLVSTIGSGLTGFALGVWIYTTTGSTTLFALSLLSMTVPRILLSPLAGSWADRFDRRTVMMFSDLLAGVSSLAIAALYWFGLLEVWHIYVAVAVNATGNTFQMPAYTAAISLMVPKEKLGNASGMVQIGAAVAELLAPALAGILFVTVGLGGVLALDFLTFLVAIFTLSLVRFPQPDPTAVDTNSQKASFWHEFTYGLRYLSSRKGLLLILVYFALFNLLAAMMSPLLAPMLLDMTTPDIMGVVATVISFGALFGTIIMSAWGGPKRRVVGIIGGGLLIGITIIMLGLSRSLWMIAASGFMTMFLIPIVSGASQALWQVKIEPAVQGRVFAVRQMVASSMVPISFMLAGPLVDQLFAPLMAADNTTAVWLTRLVGTGEGNAVGLLFVCIGTALVLLSAGFWLIPALRHVEQDLPDALPDTAVDTPPSNTIPEPAL